MNEPGPATLTFQISAPEDFAGDIFQVATAEVEYVRIIPKARELRLYFPRFAVTIVFATETAPAMIEELLERLLRSGEPVTVGLHTAGVIGVAVAVA